jgi:hypothetical protein
MEQELSKEQIKLAQEADKERVKKFGWYLGKVFNLPIVKK